MFLIVAHMLTGLEVEQSSFDKFMDIAHCDHTLNHLQQVLEQNDKLFCFDSVLETLEEALDYCDGCVDCSKILHYNLLKDEFNFSRTLEQLHDILCEKLANLFDEVVAKCKRMHIFEMDLGTHTALHMTACKRGRCHFQNICVY